MPQSLTGMSSTAMSTKHAVILLALGAFRAKWPLIQAVGGMLLAAVNLATFEEL